ncbi:TonB family protein [bacterium]|nr:TonB family protein [bacterium]
MQNREDWTGYTDRIKKKSLGITFLIHCFGLFILVGSPWKKNNIISHQVIDIQLINIPISKILSETSQVVETKEEIQKKKIVPEPSRAKEGPKSKKTSEEQKSKKTSISTEKKEVSSFSSESFKEKLIAKIESRPVKTEKEVYKGKSVQIEKLQGTSLEMSVVRQRDAIPDWYVMLLKSKIKENWKVPNVLGIRKTTVSFRVYKSGVIESVSLELSSGNRGFDISVVEAVKSTKNIPNFPSDIKQPYLDIVIEFSTEV